MHELTIGNVQLAKEIAGNIKENEEKILHHGKRADSIVKGMLMHSRTSSGTKVPTDLNVLVDEYMRLAYHGMRAKDKSFNVDLQTRLSNDIGLLNLAPQDIGRKASSPELAKAKAISPFRISFMNRCSNNIWTSRSSSTTKIFIRH